MPAMVAPPAFAQQETRFPIQRFEIEGNRVFSQAELEGLVAPFTGPEREYQDIQRALEAIEVAYRKQGYAAVQVKAPEQELTGGVVRLKITETLIDRVIVSGERKWFDGANLRASLPAIQEGTTPNTHAISAQLALANENPAKQLEVILGIGTEEGKADAKFKAEESDPLRFSVALDNTGTAQTGRTRLGLSVQHANLWNRDHVVSAAWQTSPEKPEQVNIYSLSYRLPVYDWAGAFDFLLADSTVDSGSTPTTAGPLAFAGSGRIYGLRYTHALPRQGDANHKVYVGWSIRAYDNSCNLGNFGAAGCGAAATDVTLRPLTFGYIRTINGAGRVTEVSASISANVPGGDKGHDDDFQATRPSPTGGTGARARYEVLRGSFNHLQAITGDWQLRLGVQAQWADQALLPQEQLGLAGSSAVRGFQEREVARDTGIVINAEAYTPNLAGHLALTDTLRAVAFLDAASGRNHLLAGEIQPKNSLSSWGLGLRYTRDKDFGVNLDLAQVITPNGQQSQGDWRGHFRLNFSF
jgi:hemolysin activation/secretion protein